MKKTLLFLIVLVSVIVNLYAASSSGIYDDKVSGFRPEGYRFFNGFSFDELAIADHRNGMEYRVNSEIDYVLDDDEKANRLDDYCILGYSQGGERVLAYATMLEKRMNDSNLSYSERERARRSFERLSGIITVSGIDKGILALEDGFDGFKNKIYEDAAIIRDGVSGAAINTNFIVNSVLPGLLPSFTATMTAAIATLNLPYEESLVLGFLSMIMPDLFDNYIMAAWQGGSYEELAELYDMMPQSNFIKENIAECDYVVQKRQIGTETVQTIDWVGSFIFLIPIIGYKEVPIYEYYNVPINEKTKFNDDIPVGYIVGTKSDSLSLTDSSDREKIEDALSTMKNVFASALNAGTLTQILIPGIGTLITGSSTADCGVAYEWCNNYADQLNQLKGSDDNDGLVAVQSQYYAKSVHEKVLGSNLPGYQKEGYIRYGENHRYINPDSNKEVYRMVLSMIKEANGTEE